MSSLLDISGASALFDAGQTPAGLVASLTDLTGAGHHATQGADAQKPVRTTSANGMPCVRFDEVDDVLSTGNYGLAGPLTFVAAVLKRHADKTGTVFSGITKATRIEWPGVDPFSGRIVRAGGSAGSYQSPQQLLQVGRAQVYVATYDDVTPAYQLFVDGVVVGSLGTGLDTSALGGFFIGASNGGGAACAPLDLFELGCWTKIMSAAEIAYASSLMLGKWSGGVGALSRAGRSRLAI